MLEVEPRVSATVGAHLDKTQIQAALAIVRQFAKKNGFEQALLEEYEAEDAAVLEMFVHSTPTGLSTDLVITFHVTEDRSRARIKISDWRVRGKKTDKLAHFERELRSNLVDEFGDEAIKATDVELAPWRP